jgi:hypothetical protein
LLAFLLPLQLQQSPDGSVVRIRCLLCYDWLSLPSHGTLTPFDDLHGKVRLPLYTVHFSKNLTKTTPFNSHGDGLRTTRANSFAPYWLVWETEMWWT